LFFERCVRIGSYKFAQSMLLIVRLFLADLADALRVPETLLRVDCNLTFLIPRSWSRNAAICSFSLDGEGDRLILRELLSGSIWQS